MKNATGIILFIVGASLGAAGAYRYFKLKEEVLHTETESMEEIRERRRKQREEIDISDDKPTVQTERSDEPHLIDGDEFGCDEYERITLTYYEGDGVLADDGDHIVADVENTVGESNLGCFGSNPDLNEDENVIYVRNDKRRVDYEVVRDTRAYSDVGEGQ